MGDQGESRKASLETRTIPIEPCSNGCGTIPLMRLKVFRLNESELNEKLLGSFPELKAEFENYTSWQDGMETGAFLTYEDVFRPHVEHALTTGDLAFLERAANFIERLYLTGDNYAMSVVSVGVLEGLKANCDDEKVCVFLEPVTRKQFDELIY